ncbi:MAG: tetratricopeptide repeat protein [Pseudomonadota bacterium]
MKTPQWLIAALVCVLTSFSAVADDTVDAMLREAKALIDSGHAADAYDILQAREEELAGNPAYDFVYGMAALDAGKPTEAIFALQRAVDQDPNNGPARAELARALILVNDTDQARQELEKVQAQNPPRDVRDVIEGYLTQIDAYHGAFRTSFAPYFMTGLGFDTNINNATDARQIAAPALGGLVFDLAQGSREQDSGVVNVGGGFRFSSPLNDNLRLLGGIHYAHRITPKDGDFSTQDARGNLGVAFRRDKHRLSLQLEGQRFFVDGSGTSNADRQVGGLTADWNYELDDATRLGLFGQGSLIRYPDQRARNVNRFVGGVAASHAFRDVRGTPAVFASFYGGYEDSQNDRSGLGGGAQFERDLFGLRLGGQTKAHRKGTVFGSFTYQASDYDEPNPLFGSRRDDDFFSLVAGYRYQHDRHWSVTPTITYADNDSNITVNKYDRFEFLVTVRNEF